MRATNLRTEWLSEPFGLDECSPRFSWELVSNLRAQSQSAYRIVVATDRELLAGDQGDLWDTHKVLSSRSSSVVYQGQALTSGQTAYWKVKIWDGTGLESTWSAPASWSMGLLKPEDWKADWIIGSNSTPPESTTKELQLPPAAYFRKEFSIAKKPSRATAYFSALGICQLYVNSQRIGDSWFEPGWSDYSKRSYYRCHDITANLSSGDNTIGVILAEGWYAGYLGFALFCGYGPGKSGKNIYGQFPALLVQLELEYSDGTRECVCTNASWETSEDGPIREADFLMGEHFDARQDDPSWSASSRRRGPSNWRWKNASLASETGPISAIFSDGRGERKVDLGFKAPMKLQAYAAPAIRVTQEIKPVSVSEWQPGIFIFDFGQNLAGVIRLEIKGAAGARIQLRYGEQLHSHGGLMIENLRCARATDTYILRGDKDGETWTPRFTYHGFQYVEMRGLAQAPDPSCLTALALHNDTPWVGSFECSDEVMTKFARNVQWSQRSNFIEVPTDCPQRDERLGWMGDAQSYIRTATYFADVAAFFTKWMDDIEEAQLECGAYPDYCPFPVWHGKPFSIAWTEGGIICPWTLWKVYGDNRLVEKHWESMTRFMEWRAGTATLDGLVASIGNSYGDWLNIDEDTSVAYLDTCYHALCCKMMAEMAASLDRIIEAKTFRDRWQLIRDSFQRTYINEDGSLKIDTQTAYALALWVNLFPDNLQLEGARLLAKKIEGTNGQMKTGFIGTRVLLQALSENGQHDLATRLFQSREFPSWGYEVMNGANTVWERWDSFTAEFGFNGRNGDQNASMNSFNHYAFGAVMEWAFRDLAGIDTKNEGFGEIIIHPRIPKQNRSSATTIIDWVKSEYKSVRGQISSSWKISRNEFMLECSIPPNTFADVHLPTFKNGRVTETNVSISAVPNIEILLSTEDTIVLRLPSGSYYFVSTIMEDLAMAPSSPAPMKECGASETVAVISPTAGPI
jgi:alpha-L-rhamnosidase